MSSYIYNSNDFNQPQTYITQAQADRLYLNSQGNDTITGTLTADELSINHIHTDTLLVDNAITAGVTGTTHRLHGSLYAGSTGTNNHRLTGSLTVDNTLSISPSTGISLTFLPRLQSNIQPSHPQDLCSKAYVDAQDSLLSTDLTSYRIALRSTLSMDNAMYVLTSPVLGQSTTTTPVGVTLQTVFVNLPPSAGIAESINTFSFRFDYSFTTGKTITDGISRGINAIERASAFTTSDLAASSISTSMVTSSCVFHVSLYPNGIVGSSNNKLVCTGPIQSREIWINSTNMPKQWTHFYNSVAMTWLPLNFTYVSQTRVAITVGVPNIANRANLSNWISNLSANIQLLSCSSDSGAAISKTSAYLSLS